MHHHHSLMAATASSQQQDAISEDSSFLDGSTPSQSHIKNESLSPETQSSYPAIFSYGGLPYVPYGGGPTITAGAVVGHHHNHTAPVYGPPVSTAAHHQHHQIPHSGHSTSLALPTATAPPHIVDHNLDNPALDFHGYILYAQTKPIPDELLREPTGDSIAEPGSILDEESGRTYANHETGRYFLPNDPAEQDRLDLQHQLCKVFLDGQLYRAPIASGCDGTQAAPPLKNVLDIATGTGIWAIQFAELFPQTNVVGTDISLIQPEGPPNCSWVKEDAENQEWTLPTLFDYIHMRLVLSCFDDHRTVIRKSFEQLEPGGWLEMMDPTFEILCTDGTSSGTHIERFCHLLLEAGNAVGRNFSVAKNYKQWLIEAGFVDVVEEVGPVPGEFLMHVILHPFLPWSTFIA